MCTACQDLQILEELKMKPIVDKILDHKTNWIDHVQRMSRSTNFREIKGEAHRG